MRPPLLLTPGDPDGIGPEVAVAAVSATGADVVMVGDAAALRRFHPRVVEVQGPEHPAEPGVLRVWVPSGPEPVEVGALRLAVAACRAGAGRALVTGPIHKAKLAAHGFRHPGHTEFLGELCGVEEPVMAFEGGSFRVVLVTVHLALRDVPDAVTRARVLHVLRVADQALRRDLGLQRPRLLVCGLNPHAGESGRLGDEERTQIAPAVADAVAEGLVVEGPVSAETAFTQPAGADGGPDMIVAMYHDQGLVPLKRGDFGRLVNWTLGLPIVRTSVDHGTAYGLVGTGLARPDSMIAAIELANRLTARG